LNFRNIENIEAYNFVLSDKSDNHGISAMLRVKNEEPIIQASILSIIDFVDEIIVIDNNSTDHTVDEVQALIKRYPTKIILTHYPFTLSRCGQEFAETPENSVSSLVYYYNWCKAKCRFSYLLKWDADMIAPETSRSLWQETRTRVLKIKNAIIKPTGKLMVIDNHRKCRDSALLYKEPRIYPNNSDYYYVKRDGLWTERISFKGSFFYEIREQVNILSSTGIDYYEVKDLSKDEFDHFCKNSIHLEPKQQKEFEACQKISMNPNAFPVADTDKFILKIKSL